ncbi:MAG: DUF4296 domain-containing protein [Prevotellaceae bacterium]|jgi:hypothetical protein|nr:DUF4296 domain-containing protein [Prevotellaceae bacterium]
MRTREQKNILFPRFSIFLFFLIFAFSCGEKKIIPERKLVKILTEMHLVDAALEESGRSFQRDSTAVYSAIFEKYGYATEQFLSSISEYSHSKKTSDKLYDKVNKNLSKLKAEYEKELEAERARQAAMSDTAKVKVAYVAIIFPDSAAALVDSANIFTQNSSPYFFRKTSERKQQNFVLREEKSAAEQ